MSCMVLQMRNGGSLRRVIIESVDLVDKDFNYIIMIYKTIKYGEIRGNCTIKIEC